MVPLLLLRPVVTSLCKLLLRVGQRAAPTELTCCSCSIIETALRAVLCAALRSVEFCRSFAICLLLLGERRWCNFP